VSELATVSTHILDVASGKPAAGVRVTLGTRTLTTDAQGRIADLSGGGINPGSYRLLVEVGAYFGAAPHLFETVTLELKLTEGRHYHVPLLIAPYSCTTYRGT
jgi:5-hydroxyisourate hydrolase